MERLGVLGKLVLVVIALGFCFSAPSHGQNIEEVVADETISSELKRQLERDELDNPSPFQSHHDYWQKILTDFADGLSIDHNPDFANFSIKDGVFYSVENPASAADQLQVNLKQLVTQLTDIVPADSGILELFNSDKNQFESVRNNFLAFQAQHMLLLAHYEKIKTELESSDQHPQFIVKLQKTREDYLALVDPLIEVLSSIYFFLDSQSDDGDGGILASIENLWGNSKASYQLNSLQNILAVMQQRNADSSVGVILGSSTLPYRNSPAPSQELILGAPVVPSYLQNTIAIANAEDLKPGSETQFSDAIRVQAEALNHDPIKIYQFVRNEIDTQWYAGAMKGAENTLIQKAGNDVDQASLLIALLRASGVPSRYVHGVVELPIELLQQQLALNDPQTIVSALRKAGLPVSTQIRGGRIAAVQTRYTWVAAQVPYANYRGAVVDTTGNLWLPLMPAVKNYEVMPGANIFAQMGLDANVVRQQFFDSVQEADVVSTVRAQVADYLQQNSISSELADLAATRTILAETDNYLPNSLPLDVIGVEAESPELAINFQHRVQIISYSKNNENSQKILDVTLPLSQVVSRRVTLSYLAGSVDEQNLINQLGGLGSTPAYLVGLRPQIKVDGQLVAAASEAVPMADTHQVSLRMITPFGEESVSRNVVAGGYHAIAITAQGLVRDPIIEESQRDTEFLGARLLSQIALRYNQRWFEAEEFFAGFANQTLIHPIANITFASNDVAVTQIMGQSQELEWRGVNLDAKLRVTEAIPQSNDAYPVKEWRKLSGLQGSYLEHTVFQDLFAVASVSADKGLALASEQQIPIYTFDQSTAGTVLPQLIQPQHIIDSLQLALDQGFEVTIAESEIVVDAWQGTSWLVENTTTGEAGYFISRGLAGGTTAADVGSWPSGPSNALQQPYLNEPNENPFSGAEIQILSDSNYQIGAVGETSEPLKVRVVDEQGRPVAGALVDFSVGAGIGQLSSPAVLTDSAGIAQTSFIYPEKTNINSTFVQINPSDKWMTKVASTIVDVSVLGEQFVVSDEPFYFVTKPGKAAKLIIPNTFGSKQKPGATSTPMRTNVLDEFDNPVSNVAVTYSLGGATAEVSPGGDRVGIPNPATLFTSANKSCSRLPLPTAGGSCGTSSALNVSDGIGKAWGYPIMPADLESVRSLDFVVSASGVSTRTLTYEHDGDNSSFSTWSSTAIPMPAAKKGTEYAGRMVYTRFPGAGIEGIRFKSLFNPPDTSDGVTITPIFSQGSAYIFEKIPVSPLAGLNSTASIFLYGDGSETTGYSGVKIASVDLIVEPFDKPLVLKLGSKLGELESAGHHEIVVSYPTVEEFNSQGNLIYRYGPTIPRVLVSGGESEIYLDATFKDNAGGRERFSAILPRSTLKFDADTTYEVQAVFDKDSPSEIISDPIPLPLDIPVIESVGGEPSLSVETDTVNDFLCKQPNFFEIRLVQEAQVKIELSYPGDSKRTIYDAVLPAGVLHKIPGPSLGTLAGEYDYIITATATRDGQSEEVEGELAVDYTNRNALPIGHANYENIDLFDGHLAFSNTDFEINGRGQNLSFTRSYSSSSSEGSVLGVGWSHNYDSYVVDSGCGSITVVGGDGGGVRFFRDGTGPDSNGEYRPSKGYHSQLKRVLDGFDFYSKDGTRYHYSSNLFGKTQRWYLEYIEDINGNLTKFAYNPSSKVALLEAVEDSSGRKIEFTYQHYPFGFAGTRLGGRFPASLIKVAFIDSAPSTLDHSFEVNFTYDIHRRLTDVNGPVRTEKYTYLHTEPDAIRNNPGAEPFPYFSFDAYLLRTAIKRAVRPEGDVSYSWEAKFIYTPGVTTSGQINTTKQGFVTAHSNRWGGQDVTLDYSDRKFAGGDLLTTVTDARDVATEYTMNEAGHPTHQVGPAGTMSFTWTPDDALMLSKTDENGVLTEYNYDQFGNRLSEKVRDTTKFGSPIFSQQSWTYTSRAENVVLMATAKDRNGNTTRYDYDEAGNLRKIQYPLAFTSDKAGVLHNEQTEETFTYDENGDRLSATDRRGNLTRFAYDDFGNVTQITDALGNITRRKWNNLSLQTSEINPRGFETTFEHNLLGLPLEETSPVGTTYRTWNAVGKKLTETDPDNRTTTWTYTTNNQLERIDRPDGLNSRIITYDLAGNMNSEADFRGFVTEYIYNDANFQEQVLYPQTLVYDVSSDTTLGQRRQITRQFDGVGNVTREEDAGGRVTRFDYDPLYRTTNTYQLFDDGSEFISQNIYDGENLIAAVDAENRATRFEYDALNRRIKQIRCLLPNADPLICANPLQTMEWRFDANNNLISEIDYNGNGNLNEYDAINRLVAETNRVGDTRSRVYDRSSNVIESYDGRLNRTTYEYDAVNRLTKETDARDFSTDYSYYPSGLLDTESFANGNTVVHTYDSNGLLETSTDLIGLISRKDYDADDNVIRETDGEGYVMDYVFNERGEKTEDHLWQKPGASSARRIIRTDYDLFGNVARVRDPKLNASTWAYDLVNRVISETDANSNSVLSTYDRVGNKLTQTDRRGNTTTWEYDDLYRMTRVIDPVITNVVGRQEITFDAYDNNSNLLATTDKRGFVTETTYDAENRPLITSRNSIAILENTYDATGNVVLTRDANGNTTSFSYDARNQLSVESRPHAAVTRYNYDAMGNRNLMRDPENRDTTWVYDLRNRMESQSNPELETTVFTYSLNNQQITKQLPDGVNHLWTYNYDDDNRLGSITSPLDNNGQAATSTYAYDLNSNIVTQTDAEQNATEMEYDALNRKTLVRYPDLSVVTYDSYDENSNLTAMTDANGNSVSYIYDEINRASLQNYIVNNPTAGAELASVSMGYDANNNPVSTIETYIADASPAQTTLKTYDNFDRELTRTDSFGLTTRYGYDLNGNRSQLTDPNGIITRYFFDQLNRTTHVVNNQGTTEYRYNRASELTRIIYPNNTTADYVYYPDSRINTINNQQNGVTVSSYDYVFDANGNRTTQIESNGGAAETTTYGYDNLDRLTQVVYPDNTTTYTYDLAYNRTSEVVVDTLSATQTKNQTYNYNSRKQLTDIVDNLDINNSIVYSYDSNGNQTQKTKGAEVTDFVYDVRNNMRTVTIGGSTVGQFLYDSAGLRIEKVGERGVERSTYDGLSILVQSDENNSPIAKYDYGPNRLLSLNHQTEGLQFYLTDALNSVVNLTNNNGSVQARYQYDAWGNKRSEVGSSWNRFGFTGHEHDEETGLIYAKARFYDPDTGRFLGQDAWEGDVMLPPSLHKYLYAYQNPTVYTDPDGNCAEPLTFTVCVLGVATLGVTVIDYVFGDKRQEAYQEIQPESSIGSLGTEAYAFSQAAADTVTFGYHSANKRGGTDGVIDHSLDITGINAGRNAVSEFSSAGGDPIEGALYTAQALGSVATLGLMRPAFKTTVRTTTPKNYVERTGAGELAKENINTSNKTKINVEASDAAGSAKIETEKAYRTMSEKEYARFKANNEKLTTREKGSSELYVTQDEAYVENLKNRKSQRQKYQETIEFELEKGTMESIKGKGATHQSAAANYPELPAQEVAPNRARVKMEKGDVESVGLGSSTEALEEFNSSIVKTRKIKKLKN